MQHWHGALPDTALVHVAVTAGGGTEWLGAAERIEWVTHYQVVAGDVVMNERLDRFQLGGRWVEVPVAGLFVLRDGGIALWRDYFDLATYRRQTGPTSGSYSASRNT